MVSLEMIPIKNKQPKQNDPIKKSCKRTFSKITMKLTQK